MAGALEQRLVLRGRDPYRLSAQIVAHAAVRLADGEPPAGVIPPARALDPDAFLAAVRTWGVTMEEVIPLTPTRLISNIHLRSGVH